MVPSAGSACRGAVLPAALLGSGAARLFPPRAASPALIPGLAACPARFVGAGVSALPKFPGPCAQLAAAGPPAPLPAPSAAAKRGGPGPRNSPCSHGEPSLGTMPWGWRGGREAGLGHCVLLPALCCCWGPEVPHIPAGLGEGRAMAVTRVCQGCRGAGREPGCITVWGRALSRCDFVALWLCQCQPKPWQGRQLSSGTIS